MENWQAAGLVSAGRLSRAGEPLFVLGRVRLGKAKDPRARWGVPGINTEYGVPTLGRYLRVGR